MQGHGSELRSAACSPLPIATPILTPLASPLVMTPVILNLPPLQPPSLRQPFQRSPPAIAKESQAEKNPKKNLLTDENFGTERDLLAQKLEKSETTIKNLKKKLADVQAKLAYTRSRLRETVRKVGGSLRAVDRNYEEYKQKTIEQNLRKSLGHAECLVQQTESIVETQRAKISKQQDEIRRLRRSWRNTSISLDEAILQVKALCRPSKTIDPAATVTKRLGKTLMELSRTKEDLEDEKRQRESIDRSRKKTLDALNTLKAKHQIIVNRSKNRGRMLKKVRADKESLKSEIKLYRPVRKLKQSSKRSTVAYRLKRYQASANRYLLDLAEAWKLNFEGYGELKMSIGELEIDEKPYIKLKRRSPLSKKIAQYMALHDAGVSKKKIHEFRMLSDDIPPLPRLNNFQKELDEKIKNVIKLDITYNRFVCDPKDMLTHVLHRRGLYDETIDMIIEADGRGTGNSCKTVYIGFRLLNEGRLMHRKDRSYILGLCRGDESYELISKELKGLRDNLEKLQAAGFDVKVGDTVRHIKVRLHKLADGKWLKLASGMISFSATGNACNCLFCLCPANQRSKIYKYWRMDSKRFAGKLGVGGRMKKDLFSFIPMSRRWGENMHLCLRFLGDKLLAEAFTCIVNDEMGDEATGMKYIEDQIHSDEIKLTSFKMHAQGESKDESAVHKLSWSSLSYTNTLKVAENFDVQGGFTVNEERGALLQRTIDNFLAGYKSLLVWPGDGPPVSAKIIFDVNSKIIGDLIGCDPPNELNASHRQTKANIRESDSDSSAEPGDSDVEPGDASFTETTFPTTMVTPYAHSWVNHWGEMYERSKQYATYFQPQNQVDTSHQGECNRGGLKPFLTQALERDNLSFFHSYFQCLDRRHSTLMERAGMRYIRPLFNDETIDRSTMFCMWCGRGFRYKARLYEHEDKHCSQKPSDCTEDDPYVARAREVEEC